jgi:hypothetical protein
MRTPNRGYWTLFRESAATKDAPARKGDAVFLTPDMFMQQNDPYFKTNGLFERSIVKRVEEFGNLVEVFKHEGMPGCEGRRPAILARHRFVPDCARSRMLLDRQPQLSGPQNLRDPLAQVFRGHRPVQIFARQLAGLSESLAACPSPDGTSPYP